MNKYKNIKIEIDGITFASKHEGKRYCELRLLERAGEITDLELQPRFPITLNNQKICTYIADFRYREVKTGQSVIEDAKGVITQIYALKRKLVFAMYGVTIQEV